MFPRVSRIPSTVSLDLLWKVEIEVHRNVQVSEKYIDYTYIAKVLAPLKIFYLQEIVKENKADEFSLKRYFVRKVIL